MKKLYWYSLLLLLVLAGTLVERQRILDADPRDYLQKHYQPSPYDTNQWQTYEVMTNNASDYTIYRSQPGPLTNRLLPSEDFNPVKLPDDFVPRGTTQ